MEKDFEKWMAEVNKAIEDRCGLTSDDLPDDCYRSMFDQGYGAIRAARHAISNAKTY